MTRATVIFGQKSFLVAVLAANVFTVNLHGQELCKSVARNGTLIALNGGNRSFTESVAQSPMRQPGWMAQAACTSSGKLYVSKGADQDFALVFLREPTIDWPGSSITEIDWSPSGQFLLIDLFVFQYEGEGASHSPVIYDAASGLVYQPNWFNLFRGLYGKRCGVNGAAAGFLPDGRIILKAGPVKRDPTYEPLVPTSCLKTTTFFALDFLRNKLQPLGAHYQIRKYSRRE